MTLRLADPKPLAEGAFEQSYDDKQSTMLDPLQTQKGIMLGGGTFENQVLGQFGHFGAKNVTFMILVQLILTNN